jgi:predicted nucleic acid-binding protein
MSNLAACDASALVALLTDSGADGQWVTETLSGKSLLAPSLVLFESSNIIRRLELADEISTDQAAQAHADLTDLDIEQWPCDLTSRRVWGLRRNLSSYDASYVAVAEAAAAPLVTLDRRIARAPQIRCQVMVP